MIDTPYIDVYSTVNILRQNRKFSEYFNLSIFNSNFIKLHNNFEGDILYIKEYVKKDGTIYVSVKALNDNKLLIGLKHYHNDITCTFYIYDYDNLYRKDTHKIIEATDKIDECDGFIDPFKDDEEKKAEVIIMKLVERPNSMAFIKTMLEYFRFRVSQKPYCYETRFKTISGDKICEISKIDDYKARFFIEDICDIVIKVIDDEEEYHKDATCDMQCKLSEHTSVCNELFGMLKMLRHNEEIINRKA